MKILQLVPYAKLNKRQMFKLGQLDTFSDKLKYVHSTVGTRVPELTNVNDKSRDDFNAFKDAMKNMGIQKLLNYNFFTEEWRVTCEAEKIERGKAVGIEIECFIPSKNKDTINRRFALSKLKDNVIVGTDGSLRHDSCECEEGEECECSSGMIGYEFKIIDNEDSLKSLEKVCKILKENKATINKTCGLHVHFDMRHLSKDGARKEADKVNQTVPALWKILPKSRRENEYCNSSYGNRQAFVNKKSIDKLSTVEVRAHSGTIDFNKIEKWIRICKAIFNSEKSENEVKTIQELITKFFSDKPELAEYVVERYNKFNDDKIELSTIL